MINCILVIACLCLATLNAMRTSTLSSHLMKANMMMKEAEAEAPLLSDLIYGALKKTAPKRMTMVENGTKGTNITDFPFQVGMGAEGKLIHISGTYHNTTRNSSDQYYTYMWKFTCAVSKYVPTNQYLFEHLTEDQ